MRCPATAYLLLAFLTALSVLPGHAAAKDINLGGQKKDHEEPIPPKISPDFVELPMISVVVRRDDGGWGRIMVNAYLAPRDKQLAAFMNVKKESIAKEAASEMLAIPFNTLKSAKDGSDAAKKVIHAATEHDIGRPWRGEVLIRSMLVY